MNDDRPALLGGTPAFPDGPPDWPPRDDAIREALDRAWRDGSWGKYHGGHVAELESRLAAAFDLPYALTCSSGTVAVELALRALKVRAGDEVLLAAYDYPGNFLTIHALGATPVLVDVHPDNGNLDPAAVEAACGPATRAAIVSHLHGGLVSMRQLRDIADRKGVKIVEDACQCPGARVDGKHAGTWGDVGVLSFGGSKLLTAGRGGAVITPHAEIFQRARLHQQRGNVVAPLSELQAAVLLPQLERLDQSNAFRRANVCRLLDAWRDLPGLRPFASLQGDDEPAFYKLGFFLNNEAFGLSRERFLAAVRAEGIAFDEGFRAVHVGRSPSRFRVPGTLLEAEKVHRQTVILHHPILLENDTSIEKLAQAIRKIWQQRDILSVL